MSQRRDARVGGEKSTLEGVSSFRIRGLEPRAKSALAVITDIKLFVVLTDVARGFAVNAVGVGVVVGVDDIAEGRGKQSDLGQGPGIRLPEPGELFQRLLRSRQRTQVVVGKRVHAEGPAAPDYGVPRR